MGDRREEYRGGRGGRGGGRGRFSEDRERGGRGRRDSKPDPQPCPVQADEEGKLKLKASINIQKQFAGAVIGRGGEHVAEVRRETGVFIHVCKPEASGHQAVDVLGRLSQIVNAQRMISRYLEDSAAEWCNDRSWGARITLHVLPDMASVIIGKKGSTVQGINRDSGGNVRIVNDPDQLNLQQVTIHGTNAQISKAFELLCETLESYDAGSARTVPRLRDAWENRHNSGPRDTTGYAPPDVAYGAGGPARSGRDSGRSGTRYEPYGGGPPSGPPGPGPYHNGNETVSQQPLVVMPGSVPVPGAGQMPTVLIQQADGTLVQAQLVAQAGGQYSVMPSNTMTASMAATKAQFNGSAPYTVPAGAAAGPTQQGQPAQQIMYSAPNNAGAPAQAPQYYGAGPTQGAPSGPPGPTSQGPYLGAPAGVSYDSSGAQQAPNAAHQQQVPQQQQQQPQYGVSYQQQQQPPQQQQLYASPPGQGMLVQGGGAPLQGHDGGAGHAQQGHQGSVQQQPPQNAPQQQQQQHPHPQTHQQPQPQTQQQQQQPQHQQYLSPQQYTPQYTPVPQTVSGPAYVQPPSSVTYAPPPDTRAANAPSYAPQPQTYTSQQPSYYSHQK